MNLINVSIDDGGSAAAGVASWLALCFISAKLVQKGLLSLDELLDMYDQAAQVAGDGKRVASSPSIEQVMGQAEDLLGKYASSLRAESTSTGAE